jgi:lipopolysaccharide export system ATP-binding protein
MPILQVEGLVKTYARRRVVDGVALDVEPGEIVGLLGPNGAGKTTTFRMICGMVKPDKGRVFLQGEDVTRWPMYLRARRGGMGYLPQQSSVFAKLSAQDNLLGTMQLLGFSRKQQKQRCNELLEQFKISHIRKSKAGKLSGGERRRLEIARCLVSEPKIIMLDEPFAGIDPVTVQSIQVIIRALANRGIAILITDHAAREILQTTDRTFVVSEGRILVSGSADEITRNDKVKEKYLGDLAMPVAPSNTAADSSTSSHNERDDHDPTEGGRHRRPLILFSKPRRKSRRVNAPFKSSDLD